MLSKQLQRVLTVPLQQDLKSEFVALRRRLETGPTMNEPANYPAGEEESSDVQSWREVLRFCMLVLSS